MTSLVIDASVTAKWFLPAAGEPLSREATLLFKRYAQGELRLLVPDLYWTELTNIFWKAVRQGRWSQSEGVRAGKAALELRMITFSARPLLEDAFTLACTFNRTVYDSLYVTLAIVTNTQLVTADECLANALAAHFPVKWLGSVV